MTRSRLIIGLAAVSVTALAVFFFFFRSAKGTQAVSRVDQPLPAKASQRARAATADRPHPAEGKASRFRMDEEVKGKQEAAKGVAEATDAAKAKDADPVKAAQAEQAVVAWEALIDKMAEKANAAEAVDESQQGRALIDQLSKASAPEEAQRVKEAFDRLSVSDQNDELHLALNLLPDEQFPSLYGILFDRRENTDVIEDIFNDALNRSDELKIPLLKQLMADKSHPMSKEAERILDASGEIGTPAGETNDGQIP